MSVTRSIEIYENERLWVGRGFSKKGLLPTERGPYSSYDGTLNWKSIRDASLFLLGSTSDENDDSMRSSGSRRRSLIGCKKSIVSATSTKIPHRRGRGWSFRERNDSRNCTDFDDDDVALADDELGGFAVPSDGPNADDGPTDAEGWQYFHDFTSLSDPRGERGVLDFVRRRKLHRLAYFRPDHYLPKEVYAKCDFCDSNVVDMLSHAMIDALALGVIYAHGTKTNTISVAKVLPLKYKLIDSLTVGMNHKLDDVLEERDPIAHIKEIRERLFSFADTCVGKPAKLFNPDFDKNVTATHGEMRGMVSSYFDERERKCYARLLIKDVDRHSFKMHCTNELCTHGITEIQFDITDPPHCEFQFVSCRNKGCTATFSFKHFSKHDAECAYKLCSCPNGCGTNAPRCLVNDHVRDECSLRPSECPLKLLGCNAVVQARDIACHLSEHADKHFMLVSHRMMEYEFVMKDLRSRILLLEEKNAQLERDLKGNVNKDDVKGMSTDLSKLTKRLVALEGLCKSEFKKISNRK